MRDLHASQIKAAVEAVKARVGWRQLGQEQFIISRTAGADQNGEPADQNGEGQP